MTTNYYILVTLEKIIITPHGSETSRTIQNGSKTLDHCTSRVLLLRVRDQKFINHSITAYHYVTSFDIINNLKPYLWTILNPTWTTNILFCHVELFNYLNRGLGIYERSCYHLGTKMWPPLCPTMQLDGSIKAANSMHS